jgi:hypothetical protein
VLYKSRYLLPLLHIVRRLLVEHDLQLHRSTYEVLKILSASFLDKTPIKELFCKTIPDVVDDGKSTLNFFSGH